MLLVRSKESKNLNKKQPSNSGLTGFLLIALAIIPSSLQAQQTTSSAMSTSTMLSIFMSLIVVIAIIFALAYIVRRFNVAQAGHGQMRVVASMMAGSKEKIMVIEVGDEQHLLGVTAHNINHLAKLNESIATKSSANRNLNHNQSASPQTGGFQQKLVQAMAQAISGKSTESADAKKDRDALSPSEKPAKEVEHV